MLRNSLRFSQPTDRQQQHIQAVFLICPFCTGGCTYRATKHDLLNSFRACASPDDFVEWGRKRDPLFQHFHAPDRGHNWSATKRKQPTSCRATCCDHIVRSQRVLSKRTMSSYGILRHQGETSSVRHPHPPCLYSSAIRNVCICLGSVTPGLIP